MPDELTSSRSDVGGRTAWWFAVFPPAQWLPAYRAEWIRGDAIAGVTLAAYAIPVSLAYATLAGLPPHHGIFCYLLGGLFYALFGTSRQLAIGPTSAISLLVGTTVAGMAGDDPERWAAIAALTALVVAALSVVAWILRLSTLISFISETILLGFKAGAALVISMTQLPKLFGVKGGGENFFERLWTLAGQMGDTNFVVLGFGVAAIALLLLGEKLLPGRPAALLVVVLSIVVMSLTTLDELGVKTIGELPRGLPELRVPSLRLRDVDGIVPLAAACFLLSYIESVSAARTLAQKNNYEVDQRQELLALGAANFAAAFGQGYPVAGGLSQSAVNDKAGAKTPLALVIASITLALCLLFLTDLLRHLPSVVLAAVVLVAVRGLIDIGQLMRLRQVSRLEFRVAMVALVGVLLLGILKGVLLAVAASILMLLARVARPHVAFLGRIPGTRRFSDLERNLDNETVPGLLLFRVEASLVYFNVEHVRQAVLQRLGAATEPIRLVVCDLSNSPYVDTAGARMLSALQRDLASLGVQFRLVEAHAAVRDILRAEGLHERAGPIDRRTSVDDVIHNWHQA
ncbi:MAG: SulP family inorganic anion transporter [Chromatiales bacterium]